MTLRQMSWTSIRPRYDVDGAFAAFITALTNDLEDKASDKRNVPPAGTSVTSVLAKVARGLTGLSLGTPPRYFELRDEQLLAVIALVKHNIDLLQVFTGEGKTVTGGVALCTMYLTATKGNQLFHFATSIRC